MNAVHYYAPMHLPLGSGIKSETRGVCRGREGVEILKDIKERDEDGGMRRDSLWPQEAYPLLLLLLFYNELLKPSFPSLP